MTNNNVLENGQIDESKQYNTYLNKLNNTQLTVTYCYDFKQQYKSEQEKINKDKLDKLKTFNRKKFLILRFSIHDITTLLNTKNLLISFFVNIILVDYICPMLTDKINFEYIRIQDDNNILDTQKIRLYNIAGLKSEETTLYPYVFKVLLYNLYDLKKKQQALKIFGLPAELKEKENKFINIGRSEESINYFKKIFNSYFFYYKRGENYEMKVIHRNQDLINKKHIDKINHLFTIKCIGLHRKKLFKTIDSSQVYTDECNAFGFIKPT